MSRQVDVKALVSHIVRGDGVDKCRICMGDTTEGQVFLGDTVMMDGDKAVTLAELLKVITGVEVPLDEDLPNGLCSSCSVSAFEAAEFLALCRRAAQQWDISIDMLNIMPNTKYSKNTDKLYAKIIDNNISVHEILKEEKLQTTFISKPKIVKQKEYAKSLRCQCPFCNKGFLYAQDLYKHLKESTDLKRACYVCAKIMSRDELVQHLIKKHNRRPYDCKKCPALFRSQKQYQQHLYKAHTHGACTCGDCGRSFQTYPAFHAHFSIHSPKTCPGCSKLFRNQTCYLHHVKKCCNLDKTREDIHHTKHKVSVLVENKKNKKIKVGLRGSADSECICDYCHKKFAGKKFVAAHIQIVHLKNTHKPCIYCGKFLAAAHMTTHVKKHEFSQTFKCEQCGVVLKSKLGYSQHLRLHTGEKPYRCQYCGDSFSASSRRSEHIRNTHKKSEIVLKYDCKLCPAKFRLPYRLKKHISSVHDNKAECQYECTSCYVKFASCRALLVHSRTQHHKVEIDSALPNSLCQSCHQDATVAANFKQLCSKSNQKWNEAVLHLSQIRDPTEADKTFFVNYSEGMTIINQVDTVVTIENAMDKLDVNIHPGVLASRIRNNFSPSMVFECRDCLKKFSYPYLLNNHLKKSAKRACNQCGCIVPKESLATHLAMEHQLFVVDCYLCSNIFDDIREFKRHWMSCHGPNTYSCKSCGDGFSTHRALRAHMYAHSLLHCKSCSLSFENRKCYTHHQRQCKTVEEPTESRYICDHCNIEYNKKPSLRIHIIQKHLNVLPYVCQVCGKRTSTLGHLKSHQKTHKIERMLFQCEYCGVKLRTELGLQLHERIHTGEKPYECELCGDRFLSASRRMDHIKRRHKGAKEMAHACDKCPARFVRPWELKRHYLTVHMLTVDVPSKIHDGPIKRRFKLINKTH